MLCSRRKGVLESLGEHEPRSYKDADSWSPEHIHETLSLWGGDAEDVPERHCTVEHVRALWFNPQHQTLQSAFLLKAPD